MEYTNTALQFANEQLGKREANLEKGKDGLAWLDAWLPRLPEVSHINCFENGDVQVYFTIFAQDATPEEIAAQIRTALHVQQSAKETDVWSDKSLQLVTIAPTDACKIRLVVPGAEITQGCRLEPQTFTTYKLVCSE